MANQVLAFDGKTWVDRTPQVFDGTTWRAATPLYWDGAEWRTGAPPPREFPSYAGNASSIVSGDVAELPVPADVRTGDLVVSVCAQQGGAALPSPLLAPAGVLPTVYTLRSGVRLLVAVWPWEPSRGSTTVWDTAGSTTTAVMNLLYRGGDTASVSLTPVVGITEHLGVNQVPLDASQDYTTLYAVLTVSDTLTGAAWPDGVIPRAQRLGRFGTQQISLMTADTPGAGASPGALRLDTTVETAAVAVITIPGRSDGRPTWILGDDRASVLGTTTYLE
ncbi:hypothetical protein AF335_32995 [Streptomyces eurocidicus]|uniref:Uncharacterized protein n=2 Tax=Streptomyces eurocidicus TaxID=66423 RepID=A0A2N8NLX3_STREU|nr:hypothetical protein [Streptomyces eurocidicus]MBF6056680.1 hypothetical protein [Streptomyces eurocidicus]PNE29776.1 hypothetical protein AF335_32995 [Streptomyces eurocidicus]